MSIADVALESEIKGAAGDSVEHSRADSGVVVLGYRLIGAVWLAEFWIGLATQISSVSPREDGRDRVGEAVKLQLRNQGFQGEALRFSARHTFVTPVARGT